MSPEEDHQVRTYIAKLEVSHTLAINKLHKQVALARGEKDKMVSVMRELYRVSKAADNNSVQQLREHIGDVIELYAPDYDIPF